MLRIPSWKQFEAAVAAFAQAMGDPNAKVIHDAKLPDKQTGSTRQRDVWIEARVCGHYPVNILVSCKRQKRKLHQQDIDHFKGEMDSSAAHKGVIYSYSGFLPDAIAKAKEYGISCCRLYQNQPADIPESLYIGSHYCCDPGFTLRLLGDELPAGIVTWNNLFNAKPENLEGATNLKAVVDEFSQGTQESIDVCSGNQFPPNWERTVRLYGPANDATFAEVIISGNWTFYEAALEANLLNGSYSVTEGVFQGSQSGPIVDRLGPTPGPAWKLLQEVPSTLPPARTLCFRSPVILIQNVVDALGPQPIGATSDA